MATMTLLASICSLRKKQNKNKNKAKLVKGLLGVLMLAGFFVLVPFAGKASEDLSVEYSMDEDLLIAASPEVEAIAPYPAPTLLVPGADARLGQDRVWVGGVVKNDSEVTIFVNGKEYGLAKVVNHKSGTASFNLQVKGLDLGVQVITAKSMDERGKESALSNTLAIVVWPSTPAPTLKKIVVNSDSAIERPFIVGLVSAGAKVNVIIDDTQVATIPSKSAKTGVGSFAWQPAKPLSLGRHKIETSASDLGKLSNNSKPLYWQVGDVAMAQADNKAPQLTEVDANKNKDVKVVVKSADELKTDRSELKVKEEKPAKGTVTIKSAATTGRVLAEDDKKTDTKDTKKSKGSVDAKKGNVQEVSPGEVVRNLGLDTETGADADVAGQGMNTSLIIGIIILVFLVISIIIWYIQEKRAKLGDKVLDMFREPDDVGGEQGSGGIKSENKTLADDYGIDREREKFYFKDEDDNLPPPPPPMF